MSPLPALPSRAPAALALLAAAALALPNGQGELPEMGVNTWYAFHENLVNYTWRAGYVLSEDVIAHQAVVAELGLRDLGYTRLNFDDCIVTGRDPATHALIPDAAAFPQGPLSVSQRLGAMGYAMGWYTVRGATTCASGPPPRIERPGSAGFELLDARTYALWGVSYLKDDTCGAPETPYPVMGQALNASGSAIFFSLCEPGAGPVNSPIGRSMGNGWRIDEDDGGLWRPILDNVNMNAPLFPFPGCDEQHGMDGHGCGWNDMGLLMVGGGMTHDQDVSHMALWAIMATKLLISVDVRKMAPAAIALLSNKELIAVDQDGLKLQGQRVVPPANATRSREDRERIARWKREHLGASSWRAAGRSAELLFGGPDAGAVPGTEEDDVLAAGGRAEVWQRKLEGGAWALLLFNNGLPAAAPISCQAACFARMGFADGAAVAVRDVIALTDNGTTTNAAGFSAIVPVNGSVLVRLSPSAAAAASAPPTVQVKTVVHVSYPVGAGPIINSVGIARQASPGDPTFAITTFLNPPVAVAAFNSSAGAGPSPPPVPMWSLSPNASFSPESIYFVDCARHQAGAGGARGAVDTFSLFSQDNVLTGCTVQGSGTGAAPRWTWSAPSCAAFSAQDQWRYIDASDDGSTLAAQLFEEGSGGVRSPVTHVWDAQTGAHRWQRALDANAGGYGVEVSDDGRWVLQGLDDSVKTVNRSAVVLSARDGSERGRVSVYWNIPPTISGEGDFVVGGGSSNVMAYRWDPAASDYTPLATPPLPAWEEAGWLPFDLTISTFAGANGTVRHLLGATWIGYPDESHGRFNVWDLDAVARGAAAGALLLDVRLDEDARQWDFAYVRADGPYFVVGSAGGDTYFGAPTHWLFRADQPAGPLWSFASKGGATGIDAVLTSAAAAPRDELWVAASGSQSPGGDGNGGDAYLWRFDVS